jgi:hypothetical protein
MFFEEKPDYVILSHTWQNEEVSFDDIDKLHCQQMAGYNKIAGCCKLAVRDGFDWAWIDTCCIDKRSSAELSEAINSMYKWYWQAAICYVYLSDVSTGADWEEELESSRWFTRGWTLQELLAPDTVEFYNEAWVLLGSKARLIEHIQKATKIGQRFLLSRELIKDASIATKFSWAAPRTTTRLEDIAYCMLGLLEVNMPMLYGEGDRAFYRLQLEIIRQNNDQSIFLWEFTSNQWQTTAVLAPSPAFFEHASLVNPTTLRNSVDLLTYEITNNGLRVTLPCISIGQDRVIALLNCQNEDGNTMGIWLEALGDGKYHRLPASKLVALNKEDAADADLLQMLLLIKHDRDKPSDGTPCQIAVGEILTDGQCKVNGITIVTPRTIALGKNTYPEEFACDNIERDQTTYILQDLVLKEGEAACFQIRYASSRIVTSIPVHIVFGLRKNRPIWRQVWLDEAFATHWAEDMRMDTSGDWDLVSDSELEFFHALRQISVSVEARKRLKRGRLQWTLTIAIFSCTCDASRQSSEVCVCYMKADGLKPIRSPAKKTVPSEVIAAEISCAECGRSIRPREALGFANNRGGHSQTLACDECCQLIAKSGIHYLECPCSVCGLESRVEGVVESGVGRREHQSHRSGFREWARSVHH